jgi:thiol-disulfide isomerase/thioredoxin
MSRTWGAALAALVAVVVLMGVATAVVLAHAPPSPGNASLPITARSIAAKVSGHTGAPAYPFSAAAIGGRQVRLADYAGRPLVITFFASWCAPCAKDAPTLRSVAARYGHRVGFLAVAAGDTQRPAEAFARRYGWTWPVVVDSNYQLTRDFHIFGTPMTVVVNGRGRIATVFAGAVKAGQLTTALNRLVA